MLSAQNIICHSLGRLVWQALDMTKDQATHHALL